MSWSGNRLPLLRDMRLELAHDVLAEAVHGAFAGERHQRDLARLTGLEAHRRAGPHIGPHAARLLAIEPERRIGLEEMIMRADLNGPVARVSDRERRGLAARVERKVAGFDEELAGGHVPVSFAVIARPAQQAEAISIRLR